MLLVEFETRHGAPKIYYFAYGMLTNPGIMQGAKLIGAAKLKNHRLEFYQFANIEESAGDTVHGALWQLPNGYVRQLDQIEGYPYMYDRRTVLVYCQGEKYSAEVYKMTPQFKEYFGMRKSPGRRYLEKLYRGYDRVGIPFEQLKNALAELRSDHINTKYNMRAQQFIESKKTQLDEIKMSPTQLSNFVNTHPVANEIIAGFELELCFKKIPPGAGEPGLEDESVRRYSLDQLKDLFSEYVAHRNPGWNQMEDDYTEAWDKQVHEEFNSTQRQREMEDRARELAAENLDREQIRDRAKELADNAAADESGSQLDPEDFEEAAEDSLVDETWEDFLDEASEEILDDIRENLDYSFEEWVYYEFNYLSDIADRYDFEVFWNDNSEASPFEEYAMEEAARSLRASTGLRVEVSDEYHRTYRGGQIIIEPDQSIEPDSADHGAAEIISPPLPVKETIEIYKKTVEWAKTVGAYTNNSTGLHFNISSPDLTNFNYLKMALLLGDEYLLKTFERQYNSYCKSALEHLSRLFGNEERDSSSLRAEKILESLRQHTYDTAKLIAENIMRSWKPTDDTWESEKYLSLHWAGKYMEVRSAGGKKILEDPQLVLNTINRIVRVWASAVDPNLDRQEYLKKLYKIAEKNIPGQDQYIKLGHILTQYIAGDQGRARDYIPHLRAELKRLRQKRQELTQKGLPASPLPQSSPQLNSELKECRPGK